jgi:fructokinase
VGLARAGEQERARRLLRIADIVKMSTDDLEWLYPDETENEFVERWGSGRLIVITRGGGGSSAILDGREPVNVPARATTIVDTVAAGDTFIAALLNQLETSSNLGPHGDLVSLDQLELRCAMEYATVAASLACERAGAEPPYFAEIDEILASRPEGIR